MLPVSVFTWYQGIQAIHKRVYSSVSPVENRASSSIAACFGKYFSFGSFNWNHSTN
jgi:hypothetical protein